MAEVTVLAEAEIKPTESQEKVEAAVSNILGGASLTVRPQGKDCVLIAEATRQDSLFKLRNLLRSDRIRDAARKALFRSIRGNIISFCLNKQVAFAGHVSFC